MRRAHLVTLALAGAAALAVAPAQAGTPAAKRKPQRKTVLVEDNFYAPQRLTVNRNSTIRWRWSDAAADVHDVKLTKGPRGVRRFQSEVGGPGYVFSRKLRKPGLYRLLCTFHIEDGMKMTIRVRR
jgi:plastocyanin